MVTTATADQALKSFYLEAVSEAIDTKINPFLAKVKKSTASVFGKDVRKLVRVGINGGIGAGTETGNLPASTGNKYVQFVSTLKNLYGTIEISDKAIRASANNEGAFVNLLEDEMQALIKSAQFNLGRMLYGDGSGKIAEYDPSGLVENYKMKLKSVNSLVEGMVLDFYYNGEQIQTAKNCKIVAIDRDTREVYFESTQPFYPDELNSGTYACLRGSKGNELSGLQALFQDSDTLYGVSKANNSWMKPYVHSTPSVITDETIQYAIDRIEERSGSKINFILCSPAVRRELIKFYKQRGIPTSYVELEGGVKSLTFNGIPVVADRFCPEQTMYLLNTDDFTLHQLCDWEWMEGEDGSVLKQIPGKPVYAATLVKYAELMCERPQGQGMICNIAVPED